MSTALPDLKPVLARLAAGERLTQAEAQGAFDLLMEGRATPAQIGAFLMALRLRGETVEEITGGALALRARMSRIAAPKDAVDTCGTGGDGQGSFNISTAPALVAKGHWGPAGSGNLMQKLLEISYTTSGTGRKVLPMDTDTFKGARIRRIYGIYTTAGSSWEQGTATSAAWTGNTGNGAMGTVTATQGAKVGVHKIAIVEPGTNVGTFLHFVPDGPDRHLLHSKSGVVASAYASGGLSFTLADGATDFAAGDGFDLTVSENNDGNVSRMEVIKDGEAIWDFTCKEARQLQKQFGFVPQTLMYVIDFEVDGWPDGALKTADAKHLEIAAHFTAADTLTLYAEVLDSPHNQLSN